MVSPSSVLSPPAPVRARWTLSLYPDAGEAGGCFVPSARRPPQRRAEAADPDRAKVEAARRARSSVRRYCAANRLNRLGTLTYRGAGCHDPRELRDHVGGFFRQLRTDLGGRPLAHLWVAEWHKTGHGLHVHFAVGRYVQRQRIESAWGRGFVHIKHLGYLPTGSGALAEARLAARYLAKYVSKTFDDDARRPPGMHRYEPAQGFQPCSVRLHGTSSRAVLRQATPGWAPPRSGPGSPTNSRTGRDLPRCGRHGGGRP